MVFIYYSSINDFGISGSKNINIQQVAASLATLVNNPDIALNIKSILQIPPIYF